ncbi:MAG: citramalate synthase [Candidatus Dormibacteria bacterium]|jgi:2-isopropylmalate synthase
MTGLQLYDTTLRDGAQGVGINFSVSDKLRIAEQLDQLGVTVIEGGWPGSNPTDTEFFAEMRGHRLKHAVLAAFGATRRAHVRPQDDPQLRALLDAGTPMVTLVGKTWDRQVADVLRTTNQENLRMIADSVRWLTEQGRRVVFDAEHFFDGRQSDPDYALGCLEAAIQAGAEAVALCDTRGGMLPDHIQRVVGEVIARLGPVAGIHCHDDSGCAVANSLAAVRAGATQVQGCVNGYGERTGNANLCTLIPDLQLKMGIPVVAEEQLRRLTIIARDVAEIANVAPPHSAPFIGTSAFTHKGGQHVDAMSKAIYTYQHIDPELVGNHRQTVVSELSGRATVLTKAADFGVDLGDDQALVRRVADQVKQLEHRGYSFEGAEASFELLVHRARGHQPPFSLIDYIALVEQREGRAMVCEATVKVQIDGVAVHTAAEGNGPINALDAALRKALTPAFPEIGRTQLFDYKVRVLDGQDGTAAGVRVLIESGDHQRRWSTVGCSTNVIEASWIALADAFEFAIVECRRHPECPPAGAGETATG